MAWLILTFGGDLSSWAFLGERINYQLKVVWLLSVGRYLRDTAFVRHALLTPGQQYRLHISAGGYRP